MKAEDREREATRREASTPTEGQGRNCQKATEKREQEEKQIAESFE